jgi:integrase
LAKVYRLVQERTESGGVKTVRRTDTGPGPWFLDFVDAAGRRHRDATDAQTKSEAQTLLRSKLSDNVKAQILGVPTVDVVRTTLAEFLDDTYLPHVEATRREGTSDHYTVYADRIKRSLGTMPLRLIGKADVQKYMDNRIRTGKLKNGKKLAKASINREMAFLRSTLYDAMGRGLIDRNPCARMKLLHEENTRTRILTEKEEPNLLAKADSWFKPILQTAILSGLRLGEILGLRWDDVDFERNLIFVSHESKSHKRREVPLLAELATILDDQPEMIKEGGGKSEFIFADPVNGCRREDHDAQNAFVRLREASGIKDLHFHDLRRTFASRLAQRGVSLQAIAKLLGHGATYVTERYAHLSCDDLREAVGRLTQPAPSSQVGRNPAVEVLRPAVNS